MRKAAIPVYLESGKRKTFAGALDWPGWCRSGRDESAALQALVNYGPRYKSALSGSGLKFRSPDLPAELEIHEVLEGDSTTDFGSPGAWPTFDSRPLDQRDANRFRQVLRACWETFDRAVAQATGHELRKGPRGGGRDLEAIVDHVAGAELAYLGRVGGKPALEQGLPEDERMAAIRAAVDEALEAGVRGEIPEQGPRGGIRWSARYFVRRVAWHILDHAWEIEDRVI